ncbi:DUF6262 family protein [Peribacillus butanolivorans]|uniref:DUF6262 family protein n=1 Tax=Peribacillus butanolivorans TaxID=421767 RepID=UPI0037CB5670
MAIHKLIKDNKVINFNTVSEAVGVSKPYLYKNPAIRGHTETLRSQQTKVQTQKAVKQNMNVENKDALIEILRMKVKELENKNKDLTKQLKKFQGSLYDQFKNRFSLLKDQFKILRAFVRIYQLGVQYWSVIRGKSYDLGFYHILFSYICNGSH